MNEANFENIERLFQMAAQGIIYGHLIQNQEIVSAIWSSLQSSKESLAFVANMCFRGGCQIGNLDVVKDAEAHGATLNSANEQIGDQQPKCEEFALHHDDVMKHIVDTYMNG